MTSWFWNTSPRPGSATNTPIGSWSRVAASSCREWRSDWVSRARSKRGRGRLRERPDVRELRLVERLWRGEAEGEAADGPAVAHDRACSPTARWPSAMNAGAKSGQRCAAAARSGTSTSRPSRIASTDGIAGVQRAGPRPRRRRPVPLAGEERGRSPVLGEHPDGAPLRAGAGHRGPQQRPRRSTPAHARPRSRRASRRRSPPGGARDLGPHATQGLAGEPAARLEERPVRVADHPLPRPREDDPAGRAPARRASRPRRAHRRPRGGARSRGKRARTSASVANTSAPRSG